MDPNFLTLILPVVLLLTLIQANASSDLTEYLETEDAIITDLRNYITAHKKRVELLEKKLIHFEHEHEKAKTNPDEYLSLPTNIFLLQKRLIFDYQSVLDLANSTIDQRYLEKSDTRKYTFTFPDADDLAYSAMALIQLQDTYNLYTEDLAVNMSAHDCFVVGLHAYSIEDHYHTDLWLQEAVRRVVLEPVPSMDKIEILEYMSWEVYRQGGAALAWDLSKQMLKINPEHEMALTYANVFMAELVKRNVTVDLKGDDGREDIPVADWHGTPRKLEYISSNSTERSVKLQRVFEESCRGTLRTPNNKSMDLKCGLISNQSPSLTIDPLKVELISHKPYVAVYHNVFTDDEVEFIKLYEQKFSTNRIDSTDLRVLKKIISKIQRLSDFQLELSVKSIQVINYTAGEGRVPDLEQKKKHLKKNQNMYAIVKVSLSDPIEHGGATVFPELGQVVQPSKGSAIFFELGAVYGDCPVLKGHKSVANIYFESNKSTAHH